MTPTAEPAMLESLEAPTDWECLPVRVIVVGLSESSMSGEPDLINNFILFRHVVSSLIHWSLTCRISSRITMSVLFTSISE